MAKRQFTPAIMVPKILIRELPNKAMAYHRKAEDAMDGCDPLLNTMKQVALLLGWLLPTDEEAQPSGGRTAEQLVCIALLAGVEDAAHLDGSEIFNEFGELVETSVMELEALIALEEECAMDEVIEHYRDASPHMSTILTLRLAAKANSLLTMVDANEALLMAMEGQRLLRGLTDGNHVAHQYAYGLLLQLEQACQQLIGERRPFY